MPNHPRIVTIVQMRAILRTSDCVPLAGQRPRTIRILLVKRASRLPAPVKGAPRKRILIHGSGHLIFEDSHRFCVAGVEFIIPVEGVDAVRAAALGTSCAAPQSPAAAGGAILPIAEVEVVEGWCG